VYFGAVIEAHCDAQGRRQQHTAMTASPVWFGPIDRPLFGWFHHPNDGRARAGVVICAPVAHEYLQVHYALRLLAERLEALGMCVLRFDYDGTGDSAGDGNEPHRVDAWLDSTAAAAALVRSTGVDQVSFVGMRLGALLAAHTAKELGNVDQLVLWDPCVSGRSFLAEQRALSALYLGATSADDGSVIGPGLRYQSETVRCLGELELGMIQGQLARRTLLLTRKDKPSSRWMAESWSEGSIEFGEAVGQADLLDIGLPGQLLPHAAIERIAIWISDGAETESIELSDVAMAATGNVGCNENGMAITESPVRMGPAGLFGIVTELAGLPKTSAPVAVFLNVANEHHVGPSRLWVELARRWAAAGIMSVRVDLSGLGDSPLRTADQHQFVVRAPESFEDVDDITAALSPDDPSNVILVGLSSSGYQVIESALGLLPRGVIAVNPSLSFVPPELRAGLPLHPRRQIAPPRKRDGLVPAFRETGLYSRLRSRFPNLRWRLRTLPTRHAKVHRLLSIVTSVAWRVRMMSFRSRQPVAWLSQLVDAEVDVLLVCGDQEARPLKAGLSHRLLQSGTLRFEHLPELQHALLVETQLRLVADLTTDHVVSRFSPLPRAVVRGQITASV
jgi:alpha-beta hydrolase superfamily lysophospholipase